VRRIEAVTESGVVDGASVPTDGKVLVAVMDSGIDGAHIDINYAGGVSWVAASAARPDDAKADVDHLGHGTHIAGTIAGKNTGAGVVGVSPGMPVYSLKVLDGDGRGFLSYVISAMKWVTAYGVLQGVKVVNISLAAFVDLKSADYESTAKLVCAVFKEASDAGVVIVVAAGNYGTGIDGFLPQACPSVAVVTALGADSVSAAVFSNYVSVASPPADLARVLAAPGTDVVSTVSYSADPSGYAVMSGSSMSAPHVAGVVANCILSGACAGNITGIERIAVVQAAAKQRYQQQSPKPYGFQGDAYNTGAEQYYGLLVWSGGF
jgi:subtilisin family serine protease